MNNSRIGQLAVTGLLLLSASACDKDKKDDVAVKSEAAGSGSMVSEPANAAERKDLSMVRMINAMPGMNGVEVSADDISLFTNVDYQAVTPYIELKDNVARFRVRSGARDTTIASNNEMMKDGSRYTVVALHENDGGVRLRVLHDEIVPDAGKMRLRVINGISGAGEIDVIMQNVVDPVFDNVNFGSEAGYKELDPMQGMLTVRSDRTKRELLKKDMKFLAGHSYTVVLAGASSGRVDAILVDDQAMGMTGKEE